MADSLSLSLPLSVSLSLASSRTRMFPIYIRLPCFINLYVFAHVQHDVSSVQMYLRNIDAYLHA